MRQPFCSNAWISAEQRFEDPSCTNDSFSLRWQAEAFICQLNQKAQCVRKAKDSDIPYLVKYSLIKTINSLAHSEMLPIKINWRLKAYAKKLSLKTRYFSSIWPTIWWRMRHGIFLHALTFLSFLFKQMAGSEPR